VIGEVSAVNTYVQASTYEGRAKLGVRNARLTSAWMEKRAVKAVTGPIERGEYRAGMNEGA